MKRLSSSDSLGAFMPICPTTELQSPRTTSNHVYNREFGSMLEGLDEEVCMEESGGHVGEKKRRLNVEQVKALEKNFEVENKLEPERKVRLAQELGLQPRQVAVWFQNRRARWKTKQLEKDYGVLKSTYDNLELSHDSLRRDNEALLKEIKELKAKLNEENTESNVSVKEETVLPEYDEKVAEQLPILDSDAAEEETENLNYDGFNKSNCVGTSLFLEFKDGSSDSDSSAILNEENESSPNRTISSSGILQNHHSRHEEEQLVMSPPPSSLKFSFINSSPSSFSPPINNCLLQYSKANYQAQFVKMEEHNFFSSEEACNFFSDEQPPTLHWYCNDQWN